MMSCRQANRWENDVVLEDRVKDVVVIILGERADLR